MSGAVVGSSGLDIGVYGARGVPSTYSGYETFLTTLLPELVRRGDRVTMYCRPGDGMDNSEWEGVRRRVLPALPGKNFNTLTHGLVAGVAARFARHDVVLVVNVANAAYCAIGRYTRQPTLLNTDGQEWLRDKWGGTAKQVFHRSARIAGRCATALVADCEAMAAIYRDEFHADSTVIPYCVPPVEFVADTAFLDDRDLTPYRYVLVGGRHNPENNIHTVAEAFHASDIDVPLVVLGTANYDSPVTNRVLDLAASDDRIRVLGHIGNRAEFFNLVHHASVYVHGHSVGGTNPSLVEAMGVRARICALDNSFNRQTLGPDGGYFRLDDGPKRFAAVIGAVLAETQEADAAARDATARRAAEVYSVSGVTDAYRELLHLVARSRRPVTMRTTWDVDPG